MESDWASNPSRRAAVTGLAIVGFASLIAGGIWLAVYSARFVPDAVGSLGSAAVSLSSFFSSGDNTPTTTSPSNTSTTTINVGGSSTTTSTSTASGTTTPSGSYSGGYVKPKPTPGQQTNTVVPMGSTTPILSGHPDLSVRIDGVGYLSSTATDSFVATTSVPSGFRPAVKFIIKNVGTNVSGAWRFTARIPTESQFIYQSPLQQSLFPGDSIQYILGFDQAIRGSGKTISVTANADRTITESSFTNNDASVSVNIL